MVVFFYITIVEFPENISTHRTSTPKRRNLPEWMTGDNDTPVKKKKSTKKTQSDSRHTHSNNSNSNSYDESSNDGQSLVPPKKLKLRHSYDSALTSISSDIKIKQEPISLISPPSSPAHVTPLRNISQSDSVLYKHPSHDPPSQHESDYLTPLSVKQARSIHLEQLLDTSNENESNDSNDISEVCVFSLQLKGLDNERLASRSTSKASRSF